MFWKAQLSQFCLQLVCFSEVCLKVTGECSYLISIIEDNFELLKEVRVYGEKNKIDVLNLNNVMFKTVFRDIDRWHSSADDPCQLFFLVFLG